MLADRDILADAKPVVPEAVTGLVIVRLAVDVIVKRPGAARLSHEMPDLIIMDVVMPGVNGFQATRQITRDEATRHIPVIICTTKSLETDKIWGMRQGALAYMVKPIDHAQLLERISTIA